MAFDPNEQDKNQQAQNPQMPTTASAPGAGPASGGGKTAATPQSAPAQPFQNLQSYLTANQPQVQAQGEKLAGNLNTQYGQTTEAIDKAKTDFGNQVQSGYTAANPDIVNKAVTDTSNFASDPNNIKAFQSLYNDQYAGPQNFEGSDAYGNINASVNKATSDAALLKNNAGVQNYYQTQNPNATKGGNILDSVLLQGSPEAYTKVTNAAKQFENLPDYLNQATTNANQGISEAKKQAQDISSNLRNQFIGEGGIVPTFQTGLQSGLTKAKQDSQKQADFERKLLSSTEIPENRSNEQFVKTLSDLGLTEDQFINLITSRNLASQGTAAFPTNVHIPRVGDTLVPGQNIDLTNYLATRPSSGLTLQESSSPEDYKKAASLALLTGDQSINLPGNSNQAGLNLNQFDKEKALNDINPIVQAIKEAQEKYKKLDVTPPILNTSSSGGTMRAF